MPPSGEDDDGTIDEHAYDGEVYESDQMPDETREAGPREAPSSGPRFSATDDVAQLHATIELLEGRLATARLIVAVLPPPTAPLLTASSLGSPDRCGVFPPTRRQWTSRGLFSLYVEKSLTGSARTPSCFGSPTRIGRCCHVLNLTFTE